MIVLTDEATRGKFYPLLNSGPGIFVAEWQSEDAPSEWKTYRDFTHDLAI